MTSHPATLPARSAPDAASPSPRISYARARLWLGISGVGAFVTLAAGALALDLPSTLTPGVDAPMTAQWLALAAFILVYATLHLPFDLLGGYLLPRRHGRAHPPLSVYLLRLARGVGVHASTLLLAATALLLAGRFAGAGGLVVSAALLSLLLLHLRTPLARLAAPIRIESEDEREQTPPRAPLTLLNTSDEGFTGGVDGVLSARRVFLPARWRRDLGDQGFDLARRRRELAIETGAWRRGRITALLFTWTGVLLSALLVPASAHGAAAGVVQFSLIFTLWSFLGLLTLPTLSRRGVMEVDAALRAENPRHDDARETIGRLDALQDDEPQRPSIIETIFHPIPSVNRRAARTDARSPLGFWDAARTTIFLSASGLGLLSRAVHCNAGRPALWIYLPVD